MNENILKDFIIKCAELASPEKQREVKEALFTLERLLVILVTPEIRSVLKHARQNFEHMGTNAVLFSTDERGKAKRAVMLIDELLEILEL